MDDESNGVFVLTGVDSDHRADGHAAEAPVVRRRGSGPRRGRMVAVLLVLALVSGVTVYRLSTAPVLAEEFEGTGLRHDRWSTCYYFRESSCTNEYNHELQAYQDSGVGVADGRLSLTARREPSSAFLQDGTRRQFDYTSGMVSSHGQVSFTYGYVEFRAKVPKGKGLWPALWLLPEGRAWPPEIDVMEYIGNQPDRVYMTNHPGDGSPSTSFAYVGPDFSQDWHTFALDWRPDGLTFYVDGTQRGAVTTGVPHEPMYLVMNLAVGGSWPGDPDDATRFPATMEVDYVRVQDHRPDAPR